MTDKHQQRLADSVNTGLLLVGAGFLLATQWWWPGVIVVLGVAFGISMMVKGEKTNGAILTVVSVSIPWMLELWQLVNMSWTLMAAGVLVLLGGWVMLSAYQTYQKKQDKSDEEK